MIKGPFCGIIPPIVTPLLGPNQLDPEGLERLLEHILSGGVHGLFVLGTTGEGPSLSYHLRREVIQRVCRQVNRRVPVLVGISDTALAESVSLATFAAQAGADAVVAAAPYYQVPSQAELSEYLDRLAAQLRLPLFLYNFPALTKVHMQEELLVRAMDNPGIAGLKDSASDLACLKEALKHTSRRRPDWTVLVGPEERLAEAMGLGAHGGIPGGANIFPQLYVRLFDAIRLGDCVTAKALHAQVMAVSTSLYHVACDSAGVIKGIKAALACLGICGDVMAEPFRRLDVAGQQRVRTHMAQLTEMIYSQASQRNTNDRLSGFPQPPAPDISYS